MGEIRKLTSFEKKYYPRMIAADEDEWPYFVHLIPRDLFPAEFGWAEDLLTAAGDLPPIEEYEVPLPITAPDDEPRRLSEEEKAAVRAALDRMREVLEKGEIDGRRPLDEERRAYFQEEVSTFHAEDYPEEIPEIVGAMACNIFGHICPVVFVAESATESAENRRRGRYLPFKTRVRVVRRDNYTCQSCGKHLRDDEVEFDHIIPISKGGSSEEHNLRLTCFECNREKSDDVRI